MAKGKDDTAPAPMSTTRQNRILIWRNEVAIALDPLQEPTLASHRSGISTAESSSTTSTKSSTFSRRALLAARSKDLVASFVRRFSPSSSSHHTPDSQIGRPPQTDMYMSLRAEYDGDDTSAEAAAAHLAQDLQAASSASGPARGDAALREKQDRLMRAARLLQHGPVNNAEV